MADAIVRLPDESANTGPKIDNESLTVGANTALRQRVQIAGAGATDVALVTAADGLTVNLGANNDVSLNAGTAYVGKVRLTDGTTDSIMESPGTVTTSVSPTLKGPRVLAVMQAQWNSVHGGDNQLYSTALDNYGCLMVNVRTINENPISVGAGVVGPGAQRVTLATDVALPAGNNNIGDVDVVTIPGEAVLGTATYTEATTKGLVAGAVRRDADTTLVGVTNEIAPLQVDARGFLKVEVFSGGENVPVSMASQPLPTGAATETTLAAAVASLSSIDAGIPAALAAGGGMKIEGVAGGVAVPISAASLPLPSGAATETTLLAVWTSLDAGITVEVSSLPLATGAATSANQTSILTKLAGGLPAALAAGGGMKIEGVAGGVAVPISGAVTVSNIVSVNIEGSSGSIEVSGAGVFGSTTYSEGSSIGLMVGGVRRDADSTMVNTTNEFAPLQLDARGFVKVEVFSGAEAIPISAASLPLPSNAATETTLAAAAASLANIDAGIPAALAAGGGMKVEGVAGGVALPVSYPGGAENFATEATLFVVSGHVQDIDNKLPAVLAAGGGLKIEGVAGGVAVPVSAAVGAPVNVQIGDGTRTATVRDTGSSDSLNVAIVDASGAQVTSFGGGTQYAEGATASPITGTAILWEDLGDTLRVPSLTKPLPIYIVGAGAPLAVDSTQLPTTLAAGGGLKVEGVAGGVSIATAAAPVTSAVVNGSTVLTPKFATVNATATSDLIALVSGKKLRVLSAFLIANLDGTINLRSGGSTTLTGVMTVRQGGGFVLPFNPCGWFETASGAKLDVVLATITQLSGTITYIEV